MGKKVEQGKVFIETEHRESGTAKEVTYEEHPLAKTILDDNDQAKIEAKIGMTLSLGNYEFMRVDAGVSFPCAKSSIESAYEEAFTIAANELFKRTKEVKAIIKEG